MIVDLGGVFGGPVDRYAILFDRRHEFDFLEQHLNRAIHPLEAEMDEGPAPSVDSASGLRLAGLDAQIGGDSVFFVVRLHRELVDSVGLFARPLFHPLVTELVEDTQRRGDHVEGHLHLQVSLVRCCRRRRKFSESADPVSRSKHQ